MSRLIDLTGQRFSRLTVIERAPSRPNLSHAFWLCVCDCGEQSEVDGTLLRGGRTRSCGCLRIEAARSEEKRRRLRGTEAQRIERFHAKVDTSAGPDACWTWMGSRTSHGYGFLIGPDGRRLGAHRFSLMLAAGPPPFDGALALHACDNPPCVNPSHLRWGTYVENAQDATIRGRQVSGRTRMSFCAKGHPYTRPPGGRWRCDICHRASTTVRGKRQAEKRKAERARNRLEASSSQSEPVVVTFPRVVR